MKMPQEKYEKKWKYGGRQCLAPRVPSSKELYRYYRRREKRERERGSGMAERRGRRYKHKNVVGEEDDRELTKKNEENKGRRTTKIRGRREEERKTERGDRQRSEPWKKNGEHYTVGEKKTCEKKGKEGKKLTTER